MYDVVLRAERQGRRSEDEVRKAFSAAKRKLLEVLDKLEELAIRELKQGRLVLEKYELLMTKLDLPVTPVVPLNIKCDVYVHVEEYRDLELTIVEQPTELRFVPGWGLNVTTPGGSTLDTLHLEFPRLKDLIALAIYEERCKALTRLVEAAEKANEELAEDVKRLRKIVALVRIATG